MRRALRTKRERRQETEREDQGECVPDSDKTSTDVQGRDKGI